MMLLSRFWYAILAVLAGFAVYSLMLAVGQYNRQSIKGTNEALVGERRAPRLVARRYVGLERRHLSRRGAPGRNGRRDPARRRDRRHSRDGSKVRSGNRQGHAHERRLLRERREDRRRGHRRLRR